MKCFSSEWKSTPNDPIFTNTLLSLTLWANTGCLWDDMTITSPNLFSLKSPLKLVSSNGASSRVLVNKKGCLRYVSMFYIKGGLDWSAAFRFVDVCDQVVVNQTELALWFVWTELDSARVADEFYEVRCSQFVCRLRNRVHRHHVIRWRHHHDLDVRQNFLASSLQSFDYLINFLLKSLFQSEILNMVVLLT